MSTHLFSNETLAQELACLKHEGHIIEWSDVTANWPAFLSLRSGIVIARSSNRGQVNLNKNRGVGSILLSNTTDFKWLSLTIAHNHQCVTHDDFANLGSESLACASGS